MKKICVCTVCMIAVTFLLGGCHGNKTKSGNPEIVSDTTTVKDSTVYGVCGDGCAMHTLQLITDNGDTLNCMLESIDGETSTEVNGGMGVGDRIGALLEKDADGVCHVNKAVNITSLLGKWGCLDKTFQLNPDGSVEGNVKEPRPYSRWNLVNGKLVLSTDTFEIAVLGPDSLCLDGKQGRVGYRRLK